MSALSPAAPASYHQPVLLAECVAALALQPGGTYVDVTFGGGGHSRRILEELPAGARLVAFDQDPDAAHEAAALASTQPAERFTFIQANFRELQAQLLAHGITAIDGLLADLGVSSHQFDTAARGFSTRFDGPLDMRMSQTGPAAADVVGQYTETDLHRIFGMYGEVTNARTLAQAVVAARARGESLATVAGFKRAIAACVTPRGKENKYYAQVFQALRIEVNDELAALRELLTQAPAVLAPGGRLVVLAYHSLEDKLVKNLLQHGKLWGVAEKDFYGHPLGLTFRPLTRKPGEASAEEVGRNPRARSAKLRVGERTTIPAEEATQPEGGKSR